MHFVSPDSLPKFSHKSSPKPPQVGDFLGDREPFALAVMHAYVDALDFAALPFDAAIRAFLDGFRLPGEAQKIDRLMEKFAARYVACCPGAFKSADVAYVLAYSVIMLNTDAHNAQVKVKMSKEGFLRNNRGINDGGDLDAEFLGSLYDRIVGDEIRMHGEAAAAGGAAAGAAAAAAGGWLDGLAALLPGRARAAAAGPDDEALRRAAARLAEAARGAAFFEARAPEAARPLLEAAWAPALGAFSVVFEAEDDERFVARALDGLVFSAALSARLGVPVIQAAFVSSLAGLTSLHAPAAMRPKHAQALRALLAVAARGGDLLGPAGWLEVLRCASRFELLRQLGDGTPSDASLFAPDKGAAGGAENGRRGAPPPPPPPPPASGVADMGLQASGRGAAPAPPAVLAGVPEAELAALFEGSARLGAEGAVDFVTALCAVAREELAPGGAPRVYALAKIVEAAHHNMGRIRLVWSRIWAVLGTFFAEAGCHASLPVAMHAVDALRQLAAKFLERDELAAFNFQCDFLRPFVALARRSPAPEVRELVVRCVSQLVLARVGAIRSGWRAVFMVFAAAADDPAPHVTRLAFDTMERAVREHFAHIAAAEAGAFTDCVNCLVAFAGNPHLLDVALNAVAFLRFCALELAEGGGPGGGDAEESQHAWFPLLAGLGELAADPRPEVRRAALGVLFDILALHGAAFPPRLWARVADSVLLPMFDGVQFDAGNGNGSGNGSAAASPAELERAAAASAALYETCTAALLHLVDLAARLRAAVPLVMERTLGLLGALARRPDPAVAALGVAALAQLAAAVGRAGGGAAAWAEVAGALAAAAAEARPGVRELLALRMECRTGAATAAGDSPPSPDPAAAAAAAGAAPAGAWSLGRGMGARRLAEVRARAGVQLLAAQACSEVHAAHGSAMPAAATVVLLDALAAIAEHATGVDADAGLRHSLALALAADSVPPAEALRDPPLLRLEVEAASAYLAALMQLAATAPAPLREAAGVEARLAALCRSNLARFEQQAAATAAAFRSPDAAAAAAAPALIAESEALAPVAVATLKALLGLGDAAFAAHLKELFPLLTALISCELAPAEVQKTLSELFAKRVGHLVV
jgi:brefeldin A-inhibited guanine nucleotide-exchange protein